MNDNELQLVNKLNHELGEVKGRLVGIEQKIEDSHDLQFSMHQENQGDIKKILDQTTKTNGRVTKCEDFMTEQYKINSKLNGLFTKIFEDKEDDRKAQRGFWYKIFEKAIWIIVGALVYYLLGIDAKMFI